MTLSATSIADLVTALASRDRAAREDAASELYRRGRAIADEAMASWRQAPEIAALVSGHCTVGIAVNPGRFAEIRRALGNPHLANVPPDQDAQEFEWSLDAGVHLDILTTSQPAGNGAIARFLARSGEGIQQVEFVTKDVNRTTQLLRSHLGVPPVYPETRAGADGTRVNFFLAPVPRGGKVLIELVELPKAS